MNIPKLNINQYLVIRAESLSGLILNNDNSYYLNQGDDYYLIFDNIENAEDYINENSNKSSPNFEGLIYDHLGNFIKMVS